MLLIAIILTLFGVLLLSWVNISMRKDFVQIPMIFFNPLAVFLFNLAWILLIVSGLIFFWQAGYIQIVFIVVSLFLSAITVGYKFNNDKAKAKRICRTYLKLKNQLPECEEEVILRKTSFLYFSGLRWEPYRIEKAQEIIFDPDGFSPFENQTLENQKRDRLHYLISMVLTLEYPDITTLRSEYLSIWDKKQEKKMKLIYEAIESVFSETNYFKD